jgi:hypothetical protein
MESSSPSQAKAATPDWAHLFSPRTPGGSVQARAPDSLDLSPVPTLGSPAQSKLRRGGKKTLDTDDLSNKLHSLTHAVQCKGCEDSQCVKMHCLLMHFWTCQDNMGKTCVVCQRYRFLVKLHAELCDHPVGRCNVPGCGEAKLLF